MNAPLSVAIVDDEEMVRHALARLLRSWGFEVVVYDTGEGFLRSLEAQRPDCVVLDLHMPQMDGLTVLAGMGALFPCRKVVVITGHDMPEFKARVESFGVWACLRKPVDAERLVNALKAASAGAPC